MQAKIGTANSSVLMFLDAFMLYSMLSANWLGLQRLLRNSYRKHNRTWPAPGTPSVPFGVGVGVRGGISRYFQVSPTFQPRYVAVAVADSHFARLTARCTQAGWVNRARTVQHHNPRDLLPPDSWWGAAMSQGLAKAKLTNWPSYLPSWDRLITPLSVV